MIALTRAAADGFDVVHVSTGPLSLALMPELGGKISSLRDERTGREWLWRHPRMAYRRVPQGGSYVAEADTGGWNKCFPSVAPCEYPSPPWAGAAIQDHGELWSQAARLEAEEGTDRVTLRTRWQGVTLPYTFERTLTFTASSALVLFEYTATNTADEPQHFIWCAHPLLAIEPGMQLLVSPATRFNKWATIPAPTCSQKTAACAIPYRYRAWI